MKPTMKAIMDFAFGVFAFGSIYLLLTIIGLAMGINGYGDAFRVGIVMLLAASWARWWSRA